MLLFVLDEATSAVDVPTERAITAALRDLNMTNLMMRIVDTIYSVPLMIYVILLMVVVGPGLKSIFLTIGISYWVSMARIVRSEVMRIKNEEFVLAARVLGASGARMLLRHLYSLSCAVESGKMCAE